MVMKMIILDTHIWIWLEIEPEQIPKPILTVMETETIWGISAVSLWEIAMLNKKGRITLPLPILQWLEHLINRPRVLLLPLNAEIAVLSVDLPIHSDPFDRIIAATSLYYRSSLATKDSLLREFKELKTIDF
jgi:PIN domain nuclease of toxin-antitoxin system